MNSRKRSPKAVLKSHMKAFDSGDMDAIMADYAGDAVLMTPDGVYRSHGKIRPVLQKVLKDLFSPCIKFKMIRQKIAGNIAFIAWSAESKKFRAIIGTDTYLIRGGKIVAQGCGEDGE